jgi:hypothetical protein
MNEEAVAALLQLEMAHPEKLKVPTNIAVLEARKCFAPNAKRANWCYVM